MQIAPMRDRGSGFNRLGRMNTRVRVPRYGVCFGGWKGTLELDGDVLRVVGDDPANRLNIDCAQVKRWSFNRRNGLWAFRMNEGNKIYLQTSGSLLSADMRDPDWQAANSAIRQLLVTHGARHFL
jgi:hypothetical protein